MNGLDLRRVVLDNMKGKVTRSQRYHALRIKFPANVKLLGSSIKVEKSKKKNALTSIIYMAPQKESVRYGGANMCLFASIGCTNGCLGRWSGRLRMRNSYNSKAWKTLTWLYANKLYKEFLISESKTHLKRAKKKNMEPSIRPNGTSDIVYETLFPELFTEVPEMSYYDYTKIPVRYARYIAAKKTKHVSFPSNYHLTFSRSESNHEDSMNIMHSGGNVAAVFANLDKAIAEGYEGFPVYNGDLTDFRPSDPDNHWIGLSIKGGIKDESGFVIQNG